MSECLSVFYHMDYVHLFVCMDINGLFSTAFHFRSNINPIIFCDLETTVSWVRTALTHFSVPKVKTEETLTEILKTKSKKKLNTSTRLL